MGFCVRSDSESEDSRTLEELVVCNRPQEDGGSVRDQDWTPEERIALHTHVEDGKLLYRFQGLTCDKKNQRRRYWDLVPVVFCAEDGSGHTRDFFSNRWTEHNGGVSSGF